MAGGLKPLGLAVLPVPSAALCQPGRYIAHSRDHFVGVANAGHSVSNFDCNHGDAVDTSSSELHPWIQAEDVSVFKLIVRSESCLLHSLNAEVPYIKSRDVLGGMGNPSKRIRLSLKVCKALKL